MLPRISAVPVLLCTLLLAGCSFYGKPPVSEIRHTVKENSAVYMVIMLNANSEHKTEACGIFELPNFEPIPELPIIPPDLANDHEAIANHFLDHIIELRKNKEDARYEIKERYRKYLNECRPRDVQ